MKKVFCFNSFIGRTLILLGIVITSFMNLFAQDPIFVRLYVHVLQDDDGNGGVTEEMVNESVDIINGIFNPEGIYFIRDCETEFIENTIYWSGGWSEDCGIIGTYPPHPDGINLYITCDACTVGGTAGSVPSNYVVIGGSAEAGVIWSRSLVLAHEIGHCFGLYHTEHGTIYESTNDCLGNNVSDPNQCEEFVNGSPDNREKCGDYISDTPASIYLPANSISFTTCEWLLQGTQFDSFGDPYDPDTKNIMLGGGRKICFESFTPKQFARMRERLLNEPLLTNTLINDDRVIEITSHVSGITCPGNSFNVTYDICLLGEPTTPVAIDLDLPPISGVTFGGDFASTPFSTNATSGCGTANLVVNLDPNLAIGSVLNIELNATTTEPIIINIENCGIEEITVGEIPATFTYGFGDDPCQFQFTSDFSGGSHLWDFGDGTTSTEENPLHTFLGQEFAYTVTHTVTSPCGVTTEFEFIIVGCTSYLDCGCPPPGLILGISGTTTRLSQYSNVPSSLSGCVTIAGHFIIDEPLEFYGAEVLMNPNASIEIETRQDITNELYVINSTLKSCGAGMWQGIIVNSETSLRMEDFSRIEDAMYAVAVLEKGQLSIEETTFDRNRIGIFSEHPFSLTPLSNVTFDCSSQLAEPLAGMSSEAGIMVSNGGLLSIGVSGQGLVIFKNLSNGILATDNSLMVQKASFENINPKINGAGGPYQHMGFGIRAEATNPGGGLHLLEQKGDGPNTPSFKNCRVGIKAIGSSVDISDNLMEEVRIGVSAEFCHSDIDIYDNKIGARTVGIEMSQTEPNAARSIHDNEVTMTGTRGNGIEINEFLINLSGSVTGFVEGNIIFMDGFGPGSASTGTGILMTSASGYEVANNDITVSPFLTDGTGIHISGSTSGTVEQNSVDGGSITKNRGIWAVSSSEITWECNDIEDANIGFQVDMPSFSLDGYRGNHMDHTQTGLLLRSGARISEQDQMGNRWSNNNVNGTLAVHEGDIFDILQSIIRAEEPSTGNTSVFWPESIQSSAPWFFDETAESGEPYICLQELPPVRLKSGAEDNIANYGGILDEPVEWLSAAYLYKRISDHSELLNEPGYTSFYNQNASSTVGQFIAMENSTANVYEIGAADLSTLNSNNSSLETKVNDIRSLEAQIATAPESAIPGLMANRSALYLDFANLVMANDTVWGQIQSQRATDAAQAVSQNANIATTYGFEANEQAVNDVLLQTSAMGDIELSLAQTSTLTNIADQCPLQGGNAVFRARALLAGTVDSVFYDDDQICANANQLIQPPASTEIAQSSFGLYPNPTKGEFTVQWDGDQYSATGVSILLYDLLGHKVLERRFVANTGKATLFVGNLAEGVYICKVFAGKENVLTEHLLLMK